MKGKGRGGVLLLKGGEGRTWRGGEGTGEEGMGGDGREKEWGERGQGREERDGRTNPKPAATGLI